MIEGEPKSVRLDITLNVQFGAQMFDAYDIMEQGLLSFTELQDRKRVHGQPVITLERQDLNCDIFQIGQLR